MYRAHTTIILHSASGHLGTKEDFANLLA